MTKLNAKHPMATLNGKSWMPGAGPTFTRQSRDSGASPSRQRIPPLLDYWL